MSISSKRNRTLPPERRAISSTTCGGSGRSSVAASTIRTALRSESGRSVSVKQRRLLVAGGSPGGGRVGVCDDKDEPERARRPRQAEQQIGARLVHEVTVLDREHRRRVLPASRRRSASRPRQAGRGGSARRDCSSPAWAGGRGRAGSPGAARTGRARRRSGPRPRAGDPRPRAASASGPSPSAALIGARNT